MLTEISTSRNMQKCNERVCALALCVVFSAGLGVLFAATAGDSYFLLMRRASSVSVSIVGSAITVWIPFLVSVCLIVHFKLWLAYLICGIRIFAMASSCCATTHAFGTAGWFVQGMLHFPQLCLTPVLIWLIFLRFTGKYSRRIGLYCIIFAAVIGMINYCSISPFLANLIDTYETMGRYAIHAGLDRCL